MDGSATGKVEAAHDEGPAVGVPSPACDGVVDEGGPDKDEDEEGAEPSALGDGADGKSRAEGVRFDLDATHGVLKWGKDVRNCCEHQLIDAEDD